MPDHLFNHRDLRRTGVSAFGRLVASAAVLVLPLVPLLSVSTAAATTDEAVDMGDVIIASPVGEPMTNGGSTTPFRIMLPVGAACPGDSASGNWLVQTFLIPASDDPGTIEYGFAGPEGTQFALYALDTRPVAHQVTQLATVAGGEGAINALPDFSFEVFPPGYIPAGEYKIGVACEFYRETARYWEAPIVIEANPDDQPAQLTWRLPDAAPFEPADEGSTTTWMLIGGGVAVAALAAFVVWRRRRPTSPISDDRNDPLHLARTPR